MGKKESDFQSKLIDKLYDRFPGCIVVKNDPRYLQGIPDLTVFYKDKWATLEDKRDGDAHHQPNQDDYVDLMNQMSFSRFVYPENKEEVMGELKEYFLKRRKLKR